MLLRRTVRRAERRARRLAFGPAVGRLAALRGRVEAAHVAGVRQPEPALESAIGRGVRRVVAEVPKDPQSAQSRQ